MAMTCYVVLINTGSIWSMKMNGSWLSAVTYMTADAYLIQKASGLGDIYNHYED